MVEDSRRGAAVGGPSEWLRDAGAAALVCGLVFGTSVFAAKSAFMSGGTLVVWPADGLIVGLMLTLRTHRPWLVMAAGLIGTLLAFCILGKQMVLGVSRVGLMTVAIPITYLCIRRIVRGRDVAETRVLLPFLTVCALIGVATAFARSLIVHQGWGFPVAKLTLTTTTATFVGYAIVTPLILLLARPRLRQSSSLRSQATMWGVIALYITAMTAAFLSPRYPTAYLIPLALILVAHAVDFMGIIVVILATAAIAVGLTFTGHGAIGHFPGDMNEKVLLVQAFLAVVICTTLPFSALKSDRERLRRSLVAALDEARDASQAKSTFLATISHEIRTPLNGVLGMAQAIEMDELTPAQRERVGVVRRSGESLLSLLNDVLDLSKIEAGQLRLETMPFDPAKVVDAIVAQNQALAANKGLKVQAETARLDGLYEGDPNRLRQIVQNLVSNAIKFTETGDVTIIATGVDDGLIIQVRDTGMGIPADKVGELFQKFRQVDESTTRRFGGTGLGLSICRDLAQAMGGDVRVESTGAGGSTFTFFAPLPRSLHVPVVDAGTAGSVGPPQLALRVLAAEDNATNQLVLKTLLAAAGIEPTIVDNGAEAVAAWREADWDVILMDVQMPVMDGLTAVKQIRKEEASSSRPRTMIVALTANAMDHQVREYLEVGMDDFLSKPIEVDKLFALMERTMCAIEEAARIPARDPSKAFSDAA
jgi:signal transduction histidine kinase/CheY-like chemotaxis protein